MKYFCSKCGKTTAYNLDLPKFCSACGQSFASTHNKPIQPTIYKNELKYKQNKHQEEEYIEANEVAPNINFKNIKPAFTVDLYKPSNETLGTLIDNPSKPLENNDIQFNNVNRSYDEILAEFKREAGSLRSNE
jgi:ribosomal protein S27AE